MSLHARVGAFNTGTGAATTTVAVTGLGFQPKALLLWMQGSTSTGTDEIVGTHSVFSAGFAVSASDRRCVSAQTQDAAAATTGDQGAREDACLEALDSSGATVGLMDLQSMDADGFTLVVDDQFPASYRVHYLALGGPALLDAVSNNFILATGAPPATQDITSAGFQPDCVIFLPTHQTAVLPSIIVDDRRFIGFATAADSEAVAGSMNDDGDANIDANSYGFNAESSGGGVSAGTSMGVRAEFDSFLSNGFRINRLEGTVARRYFYLALRGGNYKAGSLTTQTDTTTPIVVSGIGFQPSAVLFISHLLAMSTQDTIQAHGKFMIGACGPTPEYQGAQAFRDEDSVADSVVAYAVEHDEAYVNIDETSDAVIGKMRVQSFDPGGFTTIMSDADPTGRWVGYLAFGPAVPPIHHKRFNTLLRM